jgi:hypothetical protein
MLASRTRAVMSAPEKPSHRGSAPTVPSSTSGPKRATTILPKRPKKNFVEFELPYKHSLRYSAQNLNFAEEMSKLKRGTICKCLWLFVFGVSVSILEVSFGKSELLKFWQQELPGKFVDFLKNVFSKVKTTLFCLFC